MEPWGWRNDDALRVEGEHPIKYEREQRKKEYHECVSMINSFLTARGGNPVQSIIHRLGLNQKIWPGLFFRSRSLHADFRTPGSKFQNLLSRVGIPRGRLSGILVSSKLTQWFETTQIYSDLGPIQDDCQSDWKYDFKLRGQRGTSEFVGQGL